MDITEDIKVDPHTEWDSLNFILHQRIYTYRVKTFKYCFYYFNNNCFAPLNNVFLLCTLYGVQYTLQ